MDEQVNHIGIAVRSISQALPFYEHVLGFQFEGIEQVQTQDVKVAFLKGNNLRIELLEPLGTEGPIFSFLEKRGEGIHHIALGVENIKERIEKLKEQGIQMINDRPVLGSHGSQVAFLHPRSSFGVLYELYQQAKSEG